MYNLTKTFTFAIVHFMVAFSVTYALTGSWVLGGLVALIEPALNTIAYFFHERAWARWGDRLIARLSHRLPDSLTARLSKKLPANLGDEDKVSVS